MQKLGLALGAGGALGWSHIGVLSALSARGLEASIIAGTSMGAIVGACYAANRMDDLRSLVDDLNFWDLIKLVDLNFLRGGVIEGQRIREQISEFFGDTQIEDMPRAFACVATDLISEEAVIFNKGSVVDAISASIAVPGMLSPRIDGDRVLVDGGLINPVPVSVAREMGADYVIAVDVQADYPGRISHLKLREQAEKRRMDMRAISQISFQFLMARAIELSFLACPPDLLITPRTGAMTAFDFLDIKDLIAKGEESVANAADELRQIAKDMGVSDQIDLEPGVEPVD